MCPAALNEFDTSIDTPALGCGGIKIFQEQLHSLQDTLPTGSLIVIVSRGKPS